MTWMDLDSDDSDELDLAVTNRMNDALARADPGPFTLLVSEWMLRPSPSRLLVVAAVPMGGLGICLVTQAAPGRQFRTPSQLRTTN